MTLLIGLLTCKIVFKMTYNVSSGTLNPTVPYHTLLAGSRTNVAHKQPSNSFFSWVGYATGSTPVPLTARTARFVSDG